MHPNFDNAHKNVVNHVANAQSAFAGHSVACVDATSKRQLGRKRLSTQPPYQADQRPDASMASDSSPGASSHSGHMPESNLDMSGPRESMSRGERLTRTRSLRTQAWQAGAQPAAIWAALVIAKALAS
jgi:hypothetical protein